MISTLAAHALIVLSTAFSSGHVAQPVQHPAVWPTTNAPVVQVVDVQHLDDGALD